MKRLTALLLTLLLLVGIALLLWYPRFSAPHVQNVYEAAALLERAVSTGKDSLRFRTEEVELDEVYRALEAIYPYAFSIHATIRPDRTTELRVERPRTARQEQARAYAALLAAESLSDDMTPTETLRALHDALIRLCVYDTEAAAAPSPDGATAPFAADGALLDHKAVCAGYGRAFGMLCEAAGLSCIYVTSEEMDHGWNAVRLDGQTYFIDCTFDDPVPDRGAYVSDRHFLLTAEQLARTHVWDAPFYEQLLDSMA